MTAAAAAAQTEDIAVRTSLDRTALWVGDRVVYTIEITCKRGIDVVADDVSRDKLELEGLELVGSATDRESGPEGSTIYRFRYVLTTYQIDAPTRKIAPLRVRYAVVRPGERADQAPPAGEARAPGATLAFRSVLPDEPDAAAIRSGKAAHARPARFAVLQPIGIGLVIVSVAPAIAGIAALIRRTRRPRVRRSARAVRNEERASLEAVRAMAVDTLERRRDVFTKLEVLVRDHLRDACGVSAASLTPQEVPFALACGGTAVPAELVASVLTECELARYAPADAMPSAEACRNSIEKVGQIFNA